MRKRSLLPSCTANNSKLRKLSSGREGKRRASEVELLICCEASAGFVEDSFDVKRRNDVLAARMLPARRNGNMARAT